uniref:Uncharacterized protein n=1 Tax=Oryza punctata TaxID=4537 RepID=A0A0E0JKE1_ORYPU
MTTLRLDGEEVAPVIFGLGKEADEGELGAADLATMTRNDVRREVTSTGAVFRGSSLEEGPLLRKRMIK